MASHPRKRSPKARKELKDPTLQVAEPNGVTPESAPPERARKAHDETPAQEENSIRARRARIRATPREEGKPKPTEVPRTAPAPDSRALPEHVSARYIKVGNKYHFPNGDLAFSDRGRGLSTRLENTEVIRDLIAIAKERGWNSIALQRNRPIPEGGVATGEDRRTRRARLPTERARTRAARAPAGPRARCRPRCAID